MYGFGRMAESSSVTMKHKGTRRLYAYWNRLRRDRPAPRREEVEPGDIAAILSDTFLLEAAAGGAYPHRLSGTRVCSVLGGELKGVDWLHGWQPRDQEALSTLLCSIVSDAAGAVIEFDGRNANDQSVPLETLLLPLASQDSGYRRILGSMLPLDKPYWLGARPITGRSISRLRLIWPHEHMGAHDGSHIPPAAVLDHALPLRRMRHLALYDGGRPD